MPNHKLVKHLTSKYRAIRELVAREIASKKKAFVVEGDLKSPHSIPNKAYKQCFVIGNVEFERNRIRSLPKRFIITGNLKLRRNDFVSYFSLSQIKELVVGGNLELIEFPELPLNVQVYGNFELRSAAIFFNVTEIHVDGNFHITGNAGRLPPKLTVGRHLVLGWEHSVQQLPEDLKVGGKVYALEEKPKVPKSLNVEICSGYPPLEEGIRRLR